MDPLSLTASIIAVLQLTTALTTYLNNIHHATAEQKKITVEACNLYSLLTTLRFRVEDARTDDPWFDQVKLLNVANGPLDQFKQVLDRIMERISPSGKKERIKSALVWQWTKSDIDEALQQMERLKTLVNIALTNDHFRLSQAIHGEITQLAIHTAALQVSVDYLEAHVSRELQDRFSRWLQVPDPSTNFQAALAKRHPQTGLWLLTSQQLKDWKSSTSSLLWLHGNAGCGKTVLSATALQNSLDIAASQSGTVVAYFYFDFNDVKKQKSHIALRSLLFQLALVLPDCLKALDEAYRRCSDGKQQPSDDTVRSLLLSALTLSNQKYLIIDALDECTDRQILLTFLQSVATSPQHKVGMLVTSRREKDIEDELRPVAQHIMNIQSAQVDNDISVYVRDRLTTDLKLRKWPQAVKDEIAEELMSKANGMFRWIYCQLDSLRHCLKLSALKKTLYSLPKTLDDTYTRIIHNIESNGYLSDATIVLQWLCFSFRPLRLSEVVEVLAIGTGEHGGFDSEERLPNPEDVMVICSSLISCHKIRARNASGDGSEESDDDEEDEPLQDSANRYEDVEVRLAHFSVKEYFLSERSCLRSDFTTQLCHNLITESCLHYLFYVSEGSSEEQVIDSDYPLIEYVAEKWHLHAQHISGALSSATVTLMQDLFASKSRLLLWLQIDCIDWGKRNKPLELSHMKPPLYYASLIGIIEIINFLLSIGADVNAHASVEGSERGGFSYDNALQAASARGHEQVVLTLLAKGAKVNACGGYPFDNALQAAAGNGHKRIVETLLAHGAMVNARGDGGRYHSALQTALAEGHEEVARTLLENGADVNAQGGWYCTALQAASGHCSEVMVQTLLDKGADVNVEGGWYYGSALTAAAAEGHEQVVRILLDSGANADPSFEESLFGAPLQAAAARGYIEIVRTLMDRGVDVNRKITSSHCGNALQAASADGHKDVVQLLLDRGADVNTQGGRYGSALQAALAQRHNELVLLLLDSGADVNIQGGELGNALQAASLSGSKEVVQLLLDRGADVNMRDGNFGNALQVASRFGHEKVVQLLLDRGADINAEVKGRNALDVALSYDQEQVAKLLRQYGAKSSPSEKVASKEPS